MDPYQDKKKSAVPPPIDTIKYNQQVEHSERNLECSSLNQYG